MLCFALFCLICFVWLLLLFSSICWFDLFVFCVLSIVDTAVYVDVDVDVAVDADVVCWCLLFVVYCFVFCCYSFPSFCCGF